MGPSLSDSPNQGSKLTDRAWVRVLFFLISYLIVNLLMQIGAMYLLSLHAGEPFTEFVMSFQERIAQAEAPLGSMLLIQTAGFLGLCGLIFVFRLGIDRKSILSLGLTFKGWIKDAVTGLVLGTGLIGVGFMTLFMMDMVMIQSTHFALGSLLVSLLFFFIVSLNEELMLRGYVLGNLLEDYHPYNALGISAFLFTVMHGLNPNITLIGMANIFLAGVLFGIYYIHRRNLWFPIMIHFSWNFFLGPVFGFEVSGIDSPSILEHQVEGPPILTGGSFGFEGSVLLTALLMITCWWIHHRYSGN